MLTNFSPAVTPVPVQNGIDPATRCEPEPVNELLDYLRELIDVCGPSTNKHELGIVLITACIDRGVVAGTRIIDILRQLGFKGNHVALLLKSDTGNDPVRYRWQKCETGVYRNHSSLTATYSAYGA